MSTYLWFVGLCMLGANALGCLMLNIGWRKRLSATWALRGVQSKALYIPGSGEGDEEMNNDNRSASAGGSPRRNNNNNSSNWVPEGYYWDEQAGYYYSEDQGWYYDAVSQQYYDPQSELWYDPINQSWG